jgi:hypothetical protein
LQSENEISNYGSDSWGLLWALKSRSGKSRIIT